VRTSQKSAEEDPGEGELNFEEREAPENQCKKTDVRKTKVRHEP
jgi:hypothetical protein